MPSTAPAYTIGGITRPALNFDSAGNIVLDAAASAFAATYGIKALYMGLPANTPYPPVSDSVSTAVDANGGANSVAEGAPVNTPVNLTVSASSTAGNAVTYSLTSDSSGGGFKIDPSTGVVTVADPAKIDFETSPGHAYTITAQASDGIIATSQTFTIAVTDVAPTTPADANGAANTVAEGAAVNTLVGITGSSSDVNGPGVTYSLSNNANGAFKIDATTGVVSVADPSKIDFESTAPGHTLGITVVASDGVLSSSQNFTINVSDVPLPTPVDKDATANSVPEGAGAGSTVGLTASAVDPNGPVTSYALTADTSGGGFGINAATGVVTIVDATKIDFETSGGSYTVTVKATAGAQVTTQNFTIAVTDVAPAIPVDNNGATNAVFEGAANGTAVGITVVSSDPNGPPVTFSLTDDAGGKFAIDPNSGIVTVANGAAIDFETAPGHAYGITVQAHAGALNTTANFSIAVNNVNEAPQGADKTVTTNEDTAYTFTAADFGFTDTSDNPANALLAVKITTVPGGGTLTDNGNPVIAGNSVSVADINGGLLTFTPTANANGSPEASFTFQVQDDGGTANAGVDTDQSPNTISINVTAVNDAPVNSVPGAQSVNEDATLTFSSGTGNAITIADVDVGAGNETVTLTVSSGTLALGSTVGLSSFTNNAASITLTGSVANVNAALNGLTYHGNLNFNGTDSLVVSTNDNGNTGSGGPQNATDSISINVASVNDAPAGTDKAVSTLEDTAYAFTAADFGFTDASDSPANLLLAVKITTLPGGGALTDNGVAVIAGNSVSVADINAGLLKFTPTANANGPAEASFTFQVQDDGGTANGGVDTDPSPNTITVNVTSVNDAPAGTDSIVNAQGAHVFVAADFGFTDPTDAASAAGANALLAVEITTIPASGALTLNGNPVTAGQFVNIADINSGGLLFTPTGNTAASFTFQVQDNGGSANGGVDLDPSPNTLTVIQNTPPVANDDSLSATEAGGLNNAIAGSNPSGNVILATGSAGAVQDTDAEDPSNALTVVAVHTGPEGASLLTGTVNSPLIGDHGTLTLNTNGSYSYAVNQSDAAVQALATSVETITDKFNYTIQDTGGLQDTATITFTIHGADDLPQAVADTGTMTEDDAPTSFNVIANDTQDPDHTAANTITVGPGGITVTGPAGETFVNTDATAAIVSNQVQVTLSNAQFQQLAVGEHATVTVPYTLTGDAGETSSANLVVTVNGVNDVPVAVDDSGSMTEDQSGHAFTVLTNDTLDADHGAPNNVTTGAVTNLVAPSGENIDTTDISVSVNGSNQIVVNLGSDFQHMQDGQSATFDIPYTLHGDQAGDTSDATLHVTVTGVNDAPVAGNFTFNGVNSATGNTDLVVNDPTDGAPDPAGPQKTISGSLLSGASDVDGPGPLVVVAGNIATAHGGSVTMESDGDFSYKPPVGYTGSDSFNYQVSDQNAGVSGPGIGTGTVTINVAAPNVWYVNADAATDGDGSSENPFNDLSHFNGAGGVDHAGDTIFLETASTHYTAPAGGLQLENNEQLISQSAGLVVPDGGGGAGTVTLVSASGANAVVDGGVLLGSGNNIQGVNFGTSATFALSGNNVGTVHVDDSTSGTINNSSGGAVSITGSGNTVNMDFTSLTSGAGTNGIVINGASGTFHAHGGTISGTSGADVSLSSGTLNFTDDGAISDSTGTVVSISSMTAGTQSFTGAIGTTGSTDGAISLSSNTGATIDFSGGMALSTGTANAFSATGGGTINVTGINHLTTTTGTALDVVNTSIGSSGLTFHDISANGGTNGIVLDNTGTAAGNGGLTVTGDGSTAGSGGTIQNTAQGAVLASTKAISLSYMNFTNPDSGEGTVNNVDDSTFNSAADGGINLSSVSGVTFDHLNINGNGGSGGVQTGITGQNVSNLTLSNSSVVGFGDEVQEGDVRIFNLSGTSNITNSTFGFVPGDATAGENLVDIRNNTGTLTLNVTGSTFHNTADSTNGSDGLQVTSVSGATVNLNVSNSTFTNLKTAGIDTFARDTSTMNVNITDGGAAGNGNSFTAGTVPSRAIGLNAEDTAHLNFNINRNTTITGFGGPVVEIFGINSAVINGHVENNSDIGNNGTTNHTGSPLDFDIEDNATAVIAASGNTINNAGQDAAIVAFTEGDGGTVNNTASLDLTLASNTINLTGNNLNANTFNDGILLVPGADPNDATTMVANIHDNAVTGITAGDGNVAFVVENSGGPGSNLYLENFAGDTNSTWNANANTPADSTLELNPPASAAIPAGHNGGHTKTPSNADALFAASRGVASATGSTGETHLTQAQLNTMVAAAIALWQDAGLSADKIAALKLVSFDVADITSGWLGQSTPGHVTIDVNADGSGWFVDPTPLKNTEFAHSVSATDSTADPTSDAAGHTDLLTTIMHEMGEQLGLTDQFAPAEQGRLMFASLGTGDRVVPDSTDAAAANALATPAELQPASVDRAPTVTGVDKTATHGQVFTGSSLLNASDPDGNAVATYAFWDSWGTGHFVLNGVAQAAHTEIDVSRAQLSQLSYVAGMGSDLLSVRVSDGSLWSDWTTLNVSAPAENAPVVTGLSQAATHGQTFAGSSLLSVSDPDGDPTATYAFWDSWGTGHFVLNGVAQAAHTEIDVSAAQLSQLSYVAGMGPDLLSVRASDGYIWSDWTTLSINAPADNAPVVTGLSQAATHGQTFAGSSLLSVSDPDGDPIATYAFWDSGGTGHFMLNGVAQAAHTEIDVSAAQLSQLSYVAGMGPDLLSVRASDGYIWSDWTTLSINAPADNAPVVTGLSQAATHGQTFAGSSLLSVGDPDGDAIATYAFWDSGGTGHFMLNGVAQAAHTEIDVSAAQLSQLSYVAGLGPDLLSVRASDGNIWSDWTTLNINAPPEHAPSAAGVGLTASPDQVFAASSLLSASDPDGDPIATYAFWDSWGTGHFVLNGVVQAAHTEIDVSAAQLSQLTYVAGSSADLLSMRVSDGHMWSDWTTLNVTPQPGVGSAATNYVDASSAVNGTLSGTASNDTFVFAPGFGHETIQSFAPGADAIQVDHAVFANVQALLAATHDDSGGNAVITADANDTITVKNVTTAELGLHQDHFLIV